MGFGVSFWVTILIGFVARNFAYLVSMLLYPEEKKRKKAAKILQIIILIGVGITTALPSFDFIGVTLSFFYIVILIIDFIISEPIIKGILKIKDIILHSQFVEALMSQVHNWEKIIKDFLKIKGNPDGGSTDPVPEPPKWQAIFLFLLSIIKDIAYEAVVRKLAEWSMVVLENARKAINLFLNYVVETFIGDILTEVLRWINNITFTVPHILLKIGVTLFDILFAFFPSMSFEHFTKLLNGKTNTDSKYLGNR